MSIIERRSLTDQVIDLLKTALETEFPVGSRLPPEAELMGRFGVGRSTVREAIRVLSYQGFVEVRQGDGTFVRDVDRSDPLVARFRLAKLRELFEVKRLLEPEIVALAATRRSPEALERIRSSASAEAEAKRAGDNVRAALHGRAFHDAITDAAGNEMLTEMYQSFSIVVPQLANDPFIKGLLTDGCRANTHQLMLEAIERGDADGGRKLIAERLDDVWRRLPDH